jgi:hypothetical protein
MIETLRTERGRWRKFYLCFTKLCIFGRRRLFLLCRLVIVISLFVLLFLVRCFLLYTSVYLGAPYAFNEIGLLLIKNLTIEKKMAHGFSIPFTHTVPINNNDVPFP